MLRKTRERRSAWEVDLFYLPTPIAERKGPAYFPKTWLCMDLPTGLLVGTDVLPVRTVTSACLLPLPTGLLVGTDVLPPWKDPCEVVASFVGILERAPFVPGELRVSRTEVKELLAPTGAVLGVRLSLVKKLPSLDEAIAEMEDSLLAGPLY